MTLRVRKRSPNATRLWGDLKKLKRLLENSDFTGDEALRLLEGLEQRLFWIEEDNRNYQVFFENLISVLEEDFQPEEVRTLIHQLGLREILQSGHPETDTVH